MCADKAKEKAALVANFIDRWYVLRVINDEPAQPADLDKLIPQLVPPNVALTDIK